MQPSREKTDYSRVLVSAVGGDIGASIAKIMSEAGLVVFGCDVKPNPVSLRYLESFYIAPSAAEAERYLIWIIDICSQNKIKTFVPVNEFEIRLVASSVPRFEEFGIKVLVNNSKIVEIFLDKLATAKYLSERVGISTPKSCILSEFEGQYPFPVIIKPINGRGSRSVFIADDHWDVEYVIRKYPNDGFLVQECVGTPDEEFTTAIFSDGKKVSSITFKRILGLGGLSSEVVYVRDEEMAEISRKIAKSLSLCGSINAQSRKVFDRHVIFEINPRLSSTTPFRKFFGFDDVLWWYSVAHGGEYDFQPKFTSGVGKRVLSEVYFDLS